MLSFYMPPFLREVLPISPVRVVTHLPGLYPETARWNKHTIGGFDLNIVTLPSTENHEDIDLQRDEALSGIFGRFQMIIDNDKEEFATLHLSDLLSARPAPAAKVVPVFLDLLEVAEALHDRYNTYCELDPSMVVLKSDGRVFSRATIETFDGGNHDIIVAEVLISGNAARDIRAV
jgi:hypothetical protein